MLVVDLPLVHLLCSTLTDLLASWTADTQCLLVLCCLCLCHQLLPQDKLPPMRSAAAMLRTRHLCRALHAVFPCHAARLRPCHVRHILNDKTLLHLWRSVLQVGHWLNLYHTFEVGG